jgi:hypothetical protein
LGLELFTVASRDCERRRGDPHTAMKGAKEARERLHFIGFVNTRNFTQDEHGASIEFIANPHLLKNVRAMRAAADTWPLSSRFILNGIN